jgi:predicted kinase
MDELVRQATSTQPRQRRLNELSKQCQILDRLINADETNRTLLITRDKLTLRKSGSDLFKRMAAKLTKDQRTKLLADIRLIELLASSAKSN